jgi:hypothetical protein
LLVLADHLEAVVFRHANAEQRFVNDAADRLSVRGVFAFTKVDAYER